MKIEHKFRFVVLSAIAVLLLITFSACESKEAITINEFTSSTEIYDYKIEDISSDYLDNSSIEKCVGANSKSIHVSFFEFDSQESATVFFNTTKEEVLKHKGGSVSETIYDVQNYGKYTLSSYGKYYVVTCVKTTAVYAYCDKADADELKDFIKAIGY